MREDWIGCKVESISEYLRGITYKKENASDKELNGMFPILRANNIKDDKINFDDLVFVDKNLINSNQILRKNDILFAMSSGSIHLVGKSAFINDDLQFSFGAFCGVLRPNSYINAKYLSSYFSSLGFKNYISTVAKGSNINNLKREHLLNIQLPLPPLPEQRAIVKKLESLFSSLDAGVADLKKAEQQLKIYRQAVLKKAFEGGNEVKLSSCCIKAERVNRRNIELESSLKYIDIGSIDNKLNKIIGSKEYLWKDAPSRAQQIIKNGDILFSTVRTYLRNIAQVESDIYENEICSSGFTVLRADDTKLLNKYLFHFTLYNGFLDKLGELQTGTSYPAVRDKDVFDQLIPLPSVEEQHQIVKQIESRLSVCDSIEQNIKESLVKAEALRQSILKKAFKGNLLTVKELEECKLAKDYEPASMLLEKIKAEKEASRALEKTISRKPKIKMDKKEILVLLKENNNEMAVNQLWKDSIYENDIDAFYLKLKDLSEQGKIIEIKNGKEVTIKLI